MKAIRCLFVLFSLSALLALGGCGSGTAAPAKPVPTAPTVTFAASATTIAPNGSTTLTWTSTNATSVSIDQGVGAVAGSGQTTVKPAQTTTYTITASGAGGSTTAAVTVTVSTSVTTPTPTVAITANPAAVVISGGTTTTATTTLTVTATNATSVVISNNLDATTFPLAGTGGTQAVTLAHTTIYTATATGVGGTATATATVKVTGTVQAVSHVLFLMQENRSFDSYFGMLNPYRKAQVPPLNIGDDGKLYDVDGIDDKLLKITNLNDENTPFQLFKTTTTCLDDMSSAWLESYGDVSRFDFTPTRPILMDGFVHTAENFGKNGGGSGTFTGDLTGQRAMAYYDQGFLNYYYFMASQFALSDRWFSPVSSKSTPNRIATMTGGTTLGLVRDPFVNDKLPTLTAKTIFEELDTASPAVSWKIYYSLTDTATSLPVTTFSDFAYSGKYIVAKTGPCVLPFVATALNNFCVDSSHIAPVSQLLADMTAGTLPSFSYIEAGYGVTDEHPGSGQSILQGQLESAKLINTLMASKSWADSVFFLSYDEGGGPYDHVPPVPGHTNDNTAPALGITTDIKSIAVNADSFAPCLAAGPVDPLTGLPTATTNCDLNPTDPGAKPADAAAKSGFATQLGFRLPNMIVSPFTRKHYVSHTPMDHTAVIKFVESRFIGPTASLTPRDAAQPDLLEFFDFSAIPWSVPPTPPAAVADNGSTCTPGSMGP